MAQAAARRPRQRGLKPVGLEPGEQRAGQGRKGSWEGEQLPGPRGLRPRPATEQRGRWDGSSPLSTSMDVESPRRYTLGVTPRTFAERKDDPAPMWVIPSHQLGSRSLQTWGKEEAAFVSDGGCQGTSRLTLLPPCLCSRDGLCLAAHEPK